MCTEYQGQKISVIEKEWVISVTDKLPVRTLSVQYRQGCSLRSENKNMLIVPISRTVTFGDRAFAVSGPKLWNELPLDIKFSVFIDMFKLKL
jgi:hypothetical protein